MNRTRKQDLRTLLNFICLLLLVGVSKGFSHEGKSNPGGLPSLEGDPYQEEESGAKLAQGLMADMRASLAHSAYTFDIELKHKSHPNRPVSVRGMLEGASQKGVHRQRFTLYYPEEEEAKRVVTIEAIDGKLLSSGSASADEALPQLGALQPVDLLAPYLYWDNVHYLGSSKHSGRHKHHIEVLAPKKDTGPIQRAHLEVQEPHRYLLKAECFDSKGQRLSTVKTLSIRHKEPYHPTKIEWVFHTEAETLRIIFSNARFGLDAEPKIFDRLDKD